MTKATSNSKAAWIRDYVTGLPAEVEFTSASVRAALPIEVAISNVAVQLRQLYLSGEVVVVAKPLKNGKPEQRGLIYRLNRAVAGQGDPNSVPLRELQRQWGGILLMTEKPDDGQH